MKLTIYHDGQYWVGVVEEFADNKLKAACHIFGSEPYDSDVLQFVNRCMLACLRQAKAGVEVKVPARPSSPKRAAREAAKEARKTGVSTFAQEAIKMDYASRKSEKLVASKQRQRELEAYKRAQKVQKAKEKRRGH